MSNARISPDLLTAMRALTEVSRAWMSETNDSMRSAMNLTGRPSSMDAATAAISSP